MMEAAAPARATPRWISVTIEGTIIVLALALALLIRDRWMEVSYIPSASMAPTLLPGDRVLVKKNAYVDSQPQRGDIVLFRWPHGDTSVYVKRVIAVGGDHFAIVGGQVFINNRPLSETYLNGKPVSERPIAGIVPPDHLFVMGDNRNFSEDSRDDGYVRVGNVIGKAVRIVWPLARAGVLAAPNYATASGQ